MREPLTRYCAFSTYILLFGLASDTTLVPGATTSGLAMKSMAVGPRELNGAMVSSLRLAVPLAFDAPTVSTHGALAGAVMAPYCGLPLAFEADVAGRGDHDDAGIDGPLGGQGERVGVVGLEHARAERHVDDADVVSGAIGHRPVERLDDVADAALALAVERLERDQGGRRGDTGPGPVGVVAVAGDDAGDVRAVAPVVVARVVAVDEVDELGDPLGGAAGVAQVVVVRRDARVDHRDADALAVEAHQGLDGPGADGNRLAADKRLDRAVEVDSLDVAAAGQLTEQPLRHPRRAAAHPRQPALRPAALGANRVVGVAVVGELDDDRQVVVVALDVAQERVELGLVRPPRPVLPLRGRVVGEDADGEADEQDVEEQATRTGKVLVRPTPRASRGGLMPVDMRKAAARTVGAITRLVRSAEFLRNSTRSVVSVAHRIHTVLSQPRPGTIWLVLEQQAARRDRQISAK